MYVQQLKEPIALNVGTLLIPAIGFHWLTPAYDAVVRATTRERTFKVALIKQADFQPGQQVLDIACGTGTLAVWIKQRCPEVSLSGIDADPDILEIAARKATRAQVSIQYEQGLASRLPYPDAYFHRVVSSLFFHHLTWSKKQCVAQELYRVIRPGGELHVADWGRASGVFDRCAFVAIQLLDGIENTRDNVQGRLIELFEDAGFANVSQPRTFATVFGTLALYRAVKPAVQGLSFG